MKRRSFLAGLLAFFGWRWPRTEQPRGVYFDGSPEDFNVAQVCYNDQWRRILDGLYDFEVSRPDRDRSLLTGLTEGP